MASIKLNNKKSAHASKGAPLSQRERQLLDLLTHGLSNKELAHKLDLSPYTVKNHLARIFEKLRVRSRTAAVMAYLRER
jgi:DNA-binding NarL/FixJ family response regulator